MEEQEILKSNKSIVEFMGAVYNYHGQPNKYWEFYDGCGAQPYAVYPQDVHLKYHSDWNWLMQVFHKMHHSLWTMVKALKDPEELYGIVKHTDEFEELIESAKDKIHFYITNTQVSHYTVYFEVNGEPVSSEYDCCDDKKCIKQAKANIRAHHGKGTHVVDIWTSNGKDYDCIETCSICGKPLNEWLTYCRNELEYLEEHEWTAEFIKNEAFYIYAILQSSPTMDYNPSLYAMSTYPDKALENRERFFQRIGKLAKAVIELL
jgi:hypothetical protein